MRNLCPALDYSVNISRHSASSVYSKWIINLDQLLATTEALEKARGAVG
jgi:hypothetical protein